MTTTLLGNEVHGIYETFITAMKNNSENTASCYDSRIKEFFKIVLGKSIEEVTKRDLNKIKLNDITTYSNILLAQGNSKSTVVTKIRSVKSFFQELKDNRIVEYSLDIFRPRVKKEKGNHHDSLNSMREVQKLYEFAKSRKNYPMEQYLYIKTLFVTANRKTATMNLKWSDIVRKYDYPTNKSVWVVVIRDKGDKPVEKAIADEFYNELLQLKVDGQEKIFPNMTNDVIRYTMESFTKYLNDGRNITVHSIKASALTISYALTKDIMRVKQLGSHEEITTTQIYVRNDESLTSHLSYKLDSDIDKESEKIKGLSHEELLKIVMDNEYIKYAVSLKLD